MNSLVPRKPQTGMPPPIERALNRALSLATNQIEASGTSSIYKRNAPVPAVRSALAKRRETLMAALEPAPQPAIRAAIAAMMMGFRSSRDDAQAAQAIVSLYATDLAEQPLWAIGKACEAFRRGQVSGASLDFAPALPRLFQEVRQLVWRHEQELRRIEKVLSAKIVPDPPPRDPAKVEAMVAKMKATIAESAARLKLAESEKTARYEAARADVLADLELRKAINAARDDLSPTGPDHEGTRG